MAVGRAALADSVTDETAEETVDAIDEGDTLEVTCSATLCATETGTV